MQGYKQSNWAKCQNVYAIARDQVSYLLKDSQSWNVITINWQFGTMQRRTSLIEPGIDVTRVIGVTQFDFYMSGRTSVIDGKELSYQVGVIFNTQKNRLTTFWGETASLNLKSSISPSLAVEVAPTVSLLTAQWNYRGLSAITTLNFDKNSWVTDVCADELSQAPLQVQITCIIEGSC